MSHCITLLPGDGIGPEVVTATVDILSATGVKIEWERIDDIGAVAVDRYGTPLPIHVLESIKKNRVALKGPIMTPVGKGFKSVNLQLRQKLDLYANVRPCKTIPRVESPFSDVNLLIFRENTEGLYSGIDTYDERLEIADSIARITKRGSERILRYCFEYARTNHIDDVTIVHKANILKKTSGMFLNIGRDMAKEYPEINTNDRIIDNMCMQLVMHPQQFRAIVTTNLFGDILSDLCAGLVGGLGLVAGANIGDDYAVFEAVHGSAPDIAGKNIANPTAVLRAAEMMLRHLGENVAADAIQHVLFKTLAEGKYLTADLGGKTSTKDFTAIMRDRVAEFAA